MRSASAPFRSRLWFIPVLCVLAGLVLSSVTIWVDRRFDYELVSQSLTGGPDAALQILSTIAASMISLAALVLTITMVVVQLAMGQFSPRIVQGILQDKPSQFAIGLFVATFVHAMLTLREIGSGGSDVVPGLAIVVSYVLVLLSVAVLVLYVDHTGRALRVSALIELVGTDVRRLLDTTYPPNADGPEVDRPGVVPADRSGVICTVDVERIVELASNADAKVTMPPGLGQFVPSGAPLFEVDGDGVDTDELRRAVRLGLERTLEQDVSYGFRLLVDIAERSVSESPFQDPTTAVQAIDRLHDALRQLATREMPDGEFRDGEGAVRFEMPTMDWDAYVRLAFEEIILAGSGSPQVERRLVAALVDLKVIAPPARQEILDHTLQRLRDRVGERDAEEPDVDLRPDPHGIGPNAGRNAPA
ncbi:DUF2254 domain-containing protein [Dermatobacter hominis]|uniref:DUF2254 domain-containing protein n=1 Tax=Dermatobacter hominis TaxID=2884263 RepID=UPI001D0FD168|nr:DUF2254 domain-containing protein [Dermatobacter hominis]UDY35015.1 DUF2254 domain-containing protein [Dermatobacter hominis]